MSNPKTYYQSIIESLSGILILFLVQNSRRMADAVLPLSQSTIANNQHRDAEIASLEASILLLESIVSCLKLACRLQQNICNTTYTPGQHPAHTNSFQVKLIYVAIMAIAVNGIYNWNHDIKITSNGKLALPDILFSLTPFASELQADCLFIKLSSARLYKPLSRLPIISYAAHIFARSAQNTIITLCAYFKTPTIYKNSKKIVIRLHQIESSLTKIAVKSTTPALDYLYDTYTLHLAHGLCVATCISLMMAFKIKQWPAIILQKTDLSPQHVFNIAKIDMGTVTSFMLPMMVLTIIASITLHIFSALCYDLCLKKSVTPSSWKHRQLGISARDTIEKWCSKKLWGLLPVDQLFILAITSTVWAMAMHSPEQHLIMHIFKLYTPCVKITADITQILYNSSVTGRSIQLILILSAPITLAMTLSAIAYAKPPSQNKTYQSKHNYSIIADVVMSSILLSIYYLLESNPTGNEISTLCAACGLLIGFCMVKTLPAIFISTRPDSQGAQDQQLDLLIDTDYDRAHGESDSKQLISSGCAGSFTRAKAQVAITAAAFFISSALLVEQRSREPATQCLPTP